ncbi:MAG: AMP-binding protein [Chloroflexi bacterium]|nr:AMP-binding protein [Chloroflexota bacterium]
MPSSPLRGVNVTESIVPRYHRTIDFEVLTREYPPPPEYFDNVWRWPREQIDALQGQRLREAIHRAWQIPFHRRRWSEAGLNPFHIRDGSDLPRIPFYTIDDIRESLERCPPLGDYHPFTLDEARHTPLRIFWSGGTTGEPRPTVFTQWDREVGAILSARTYYLHGLRPGDVVMNAWAYSTHNAAWIMDHALWHWLGCVPITTGTGLVTPSERQIEIAQQYGVTSILAVSDYLLHLAATARKMGLDPQQDLNVHTLSAFGNTGPVKEAWGCPVYDSYAFHEVQYVAAECPVGGGLHVFEDAFIVEIVDFETGKPLPAGEQGNIVVTCLYKTGTQQIRYNIQDISRLYPPGRCACGSWLRRMDPFQGRSDTMVKLRGINIWPEAIGRLIAGETRLNGEYFCYVERVEGATGPRDEMTVLVECLDADADRESIRRDLEEHLRNRLGVQLNVRPVAPTELHALTGYGVRAKLVRFQDRRR